MSKQVAGNQPTVEDITGSLNGFDELAIEKKFGKELGSLNGTMTLRALVFVLERRNGKEDREAYNEAMRRTLIECRDTFASSSPAVPDDEEAAGGEG